MINLPLETFALRTMRRRRGDFDEHAYDAMLAGIDRLVEAGMPTDEAVRTAVSAFTSSLDVTVPDVVMRLMRTAPRMLRRSRRIQRRFERRLRRHWGAALDLFYAVTVCAEEAGRDFDTRHAPAAAGRDDFLFEALTGLHARACRTAVEVYHLLCSGLPMGALARCRTMHELAVTAMVLAEYGTEDRHADLGERYVLHADVLTWSDAKTYQEHCTALGYQPFGEAEMAEMQNQRDALVDRFGRSYGSEYGWAAHLVGVQRPTFRGLEQLAELSHLRPHYRRASHEVHSDAKGWALNVYERGGISYRSTGVTNVGLADPGHMALISLQQSLVSLLFSAEDISPRDLLAAKAVQGLVDHAGDAFERGERSVECGTTLVTRQQNDLAPRAFGREPK